MPPPRRRRRPLVLHFDINKTLIICDPVSGVGTDAMINSLLAECTWGRVEETRGNLTEKTFLLLSSAPSTKPPPDTDVMTYNEYLENILGPPRASKKQYKARFTEVGEIGERFRPYFVRLKEALQIPSEKRETAAAQLPQLSHGQYHILPSFFKLINWLQEEGREYHLIFRSFGTDIPTIAEEWNCFCEGRHPLFPVTETDHLHGRKLNFPADTGAFSRGEGGDLRLALVSERSQTLQIVKGFVNVHDAIMAKLQAQPYRSLALQDDYAYWAEQEESDDSGKVLLLDLKEEEEEGATEHPAPPHHHIFFDDNIERNRPHIVDARDIRSGQALPYLEFSRGRHLIKVEPLHAVLDSDYFIKALEEVDCLMGFR